jgi:hypothetical protein
MKYYVGNTWQMIVASPLINTIGEQKMSVVLKGIIFLPKAG